MEDRLTALEADLSHNTAANEAMSGIIDQVQPLELFLSFADFENQVVADHTCLPPLLRLLITFWPRVLALSPMAAGHGIKGVLH